MSRKVTKKPRTEAAAETPDLVLPPQSESEIGARRSTLEELQAATLVEVSYLFGDGPVLVAGLGVTAAPRVFSVSSVRSQGKSHLRALAYDESISVRVVK